LNSKVPLNTIILSPTAVAGLTTSLNVMKSVFLGSTCTDCLVLRRRKGGAGNYRRLREFRFAGGGLPDYYDYLIVSFIKLLAPTIFKDSTLEFSAIALRKRVYER
jgi:hypothetical protein